MKIINGTILITAFIALFLAATVALIFTFTSAAAADTFGQASLNGFVFDSTKSIPVAGAQITVRERTVKTDQDGRFIVSGLVPGRLIIEVRKKDYEDFMETVTVEKGDNSFNVKIKPVARPVQVAVAPRKVTKINVKVSSAAAKSPNEYTVRVNEIKTALAGDKPQARETAEVKMAQAAIGYRIAGNVMDIVTKAPIANASVIIDGKTYVSGSEGSFETGLLSKRQVEVSASAEGFIPFKGTTRLTGKITKANILLLPAKAQNEKISEIAEGTSSAGQQSASNSKGAIVHGRIIGAKGGGPVSGASVIIGTKSVKTDGNGIYSVDSLAIGEQADVTVVAGKYGIYRGKVTVAGPVNEHDITLNYDETICSINGCISDIKTGKPISGVRVTILNRASSSDKAGNYFIKDITADYYSLKAERAGYAVYEKTVHVTRDLEIINIEMNEL